jgi:hypothetical protein
MHLPAGIPLPVAPGDATVDVEPPATLWATADTIFPRRLRLTCSTACRHGRRVREGHRSKRRGSKEEPEKSAFSHITYRRPHNFPLSPPCHAVKSFRGLPKTILKCIREVLRIVFCEFPRTGADTRMAAQPWHCLTCESAVPTAIRNGDRHGSGDRTQPGSRVSDSAIRARQLISPRVWLVLALAMSYLHEALTPSGFARSPSP